jgi:hypothetical protein
MANGEGLLSPLRSVWYPTLNAFVVNDCGLE